MAEGGARSRMREDVPAGFRACYPGASSDDEEEPATPALPRQGTGASNLNTTVNTWASSCTPALPRRGTGASNLNTTVNTLASSSKSPYRTRSGRRSLRQKSLQSGSSEELSRQESVYSYHSCRSRFDREWRVDTDPGLTQFVAEVFEEEEEESGLPIPGPLDVDPDTAAKKASQFALLKIETLSKMSSQMLILGLYVTVVACVVLCAVDETYMWECLDICGQSHSHSTWSSGQPCGAGDSSSCMAEYNVPPQPPPRSGDVGDDDGSGVISSVLWTGHISGLTKLNRFLHMTYLMDNPSMQNATLVNLWRLRVQQLAYTSPDAPPYNKTFTLTLSCTLQQERCTTMQLPVAGLPWSEAYNISVMLIDPPEELEPYLTSVSIVFQYQVGWYTQMEVVVRLLLIVLSVLHLVDFMHTLWKIPFKDWLTEQQYIPIAFMFLVMYIDPFVLTEILLDTEIELFRYLAFHSSTYFILCIQVFVVVVLTSVRRASGVVTWRTNALVACWFVLMVALDGAQSSYFEDASGDYASSFFWFPFTHDLSQISASALVFYAIGVGLEAAWLAWTVRGYYRAKRKLRKQSYFATRHRQLSFRYWVFTCMGFVVYEAATAIIMMVIHRGFTIGYRSSEELSTVIFATAFMNVMAYIYAPAFVDEGAPPAPCDPSWQDAYWKRGKWKSEWYEWLADHGGSLYFFIQKDEEDNYLAAQHLPGSDDEFDPQPSLPGSPTMNHYPTEFSFDYDREPTSPLTVASPSSPLLGRGGRGYSSGSPERQSVFETPERYTEQYTSVRRPRKTGGGKRKARSPLIRLIRRVMGLTTAPLRILENALFSEGYRGCPRLFFCLETATTMLNLSFCAYYPPTDWVDAEVQECFNGGASYADVEQVLGPIGSFTLKTYEQMFLGADYVAVLAAAAAVQCVSEVKVQALVADTATPSSTGWRDLWGMIGRNPGTPRDDQPDSPQHSPQSDHDDIPTKVDSYGYRLFDCVQKNGILVLIAVPKATQPRDHIVVSFRGTANFANVNTDVKVRRCVWWEMVDDDDAGCRCCCGAGFCGVTDTPLLHSGFAELWDAIQTEVLMSIKECMGTFSFHPKVYITGHSLGGAMASLCAYTATVKLRLLPVVYTFGSPKLGNRAFQQRYNFTVPNTFRVVNEADVVAHWSFTCQNFHVGHEVCISRGNLLVEPTWIEQTFQPTKAGTAKWASHSLYRYARTLNKICARYGLEELCLNGKVRGYHEGFERMSAYASSDGEFESHEESGLTDRQFSLERGATAL
eukprot:TRINITY_DN11296_c0_g1_i1.p1 TRINITY_DN11296_c0_g1~~TRINITY_DN11296_c0_g1_i1.p1  ORF type:complete len:1265 (+),score=362.19 TRINITY_DN11296_c0_g1_i1:83-3877(+)